MENYLLGLLMRFFKDWQLNQVQDNSKAVFELADEIQKIIDDKG